MAAIAFFFLLPFLSALHDAAPVLGFTRSDFPQDFVFGAATSAYQYEGAVAEDGRSPSIWDTFTHAGKTPDKSTGDVAADGYHSLRSAKQGTAPSFTLVRGPVKLEAGRSIRVIKEVKKIPLKKEGCKLRVRITIALELSCGRSPVLLIDDVGLLADTNLEAYRFSISWSRLIPSGRGAVNEKGLEYYNNLIDELVKRGIQVHVMLYQLDLPQVLEDEYGGWLSPRIVEDFTAYADVCFRQFGDKVSHWTTIDEPNVAAIGSYDTGQIAPGRCSDPFGLRKCTVGDSTVEPYIAAHNMLLAHASAARLYRGKYQAVQKGVVGINVYTFWAYPLTNSTIDLEATRRCRDFMFGWILEPLVFGDYPHVMKKIVGSRLPSFTKVQYEAIKGSIDFIGINHYYSLYVNDRTLDKGVRDYAADMSVYYRGSKTDPPIGKYAPTSIPDDPEGLQLELQYLQESYGDLPIYIQENGNASSNDTVHDNDRVDYLKSFIGATLAALRHGVNVKGYFAWASMDVFEFLSGYQARYGLYRVDFDDETLPRQARLSAHWYSNFLKNSGIHIRNELDDGGSHAQQ